MTSTPPPAPPALDRKTLIVHSGTYKTGSSAIQLYLSRAEEAGRLGDARYPALGRSYTRQHINLNAELRGGNMFDPRLGSWDDVIAGLMAGDGPAAVVSTENFSTLSAQALRTIGEKTRAAGVRVRWIHYLREQSSFYNAFYVERLINLRPEFRDLVDLPFEEFGTWSPIELDFLDYGSFAETVLREIPDVDLVLRPFSRRHLVDADAVADFCATAGLPFDPALAKSANVGTGWRTVETARRLTPLVRSAELRKRCAVFEHRPTARFRWISLLRSELIRASTAVGWNTESAIYLTPAFREVLRERYRAENERVSALAGFDWAAIADAEPSKEYNVGDYADIPGDEVLAVVERVTRLLVSMPEEIKAMPRKAAPAAASPSLARRAVRYARRQLQREPRPSASARS